MANYLYNGIELPALPEWDKEQYPFAIIFDVFSNYDLYIGTGPHYIQKDNGKYVFGPRVALEYTKFKTIGNSWTRITDIQDEDGDGFRDEIFTADINTDNVVWTNTDILDQEGKVVIAASDPVPVPDEPDTPDPDIPDPEPPEPDEPNPPDTTIMGLITDRTSRNVVRRNELAAKGWARMTDAERGEWVGDPLSTVGVNLLPLGAYYSSTVGLTYKNSEFRATATSGGTYLYAVLIIGDAAKYENKQFTLSVDAMISTVGCAPQLALYWHDENGFEYAGATLTRDGSVTVNLANYPNTNGRASLALYVYVTTDAEVAAGAYARFVGVMFENGATRHEYVPYAEIVPTLATKGAYNYSDLNRVERAVKEISDTRGLGLTTKTDWAMWDIPRKSDMKRYLDNVKTIAFVIGSDIELPDSMDKLTYEMANNIEKVLVEGSKY